MNAIEQGTDAKIRWCRGYYDALIAKAEEVTALFATLPNTGRAYQGRSDKGPYLSGARVFGTENVGLVSSTNFTELSDARFSGWNNRQFHYCPEGKWAEWVILARHIIEVDDAWKRKQINDVST